MTAPAATDWVQRRFDAAGLHPAWLGLGIALVAFALSTGMRLAVGDEKLRAFLLVDAVSAVVMGYLPAAIAWLRRSVVRDFEELRPVLRDEETARALLREAVCPSPGVLLAGGLLGAFSLALMMLDTNFWPDGRPSLLSPMFLFLLLRQIVMGFLAGLAVVAETVSVRTYARMGRSAIEVDLLDTGRLRPFARRGLRSGFVWLLCSSLVSLFWLGPAASSSNGPIIAAIGVLVGLAFFRCVRGVRESIRRAKAQRLGAIHAEIRRESDALLAGRGATAPGDARLANLIALKGLIEGVHEWPFDAPVLLRFGLLALLGLGSWLGGALVERLLDTALG